ncbi:MAG TPA: hypothetical protein VGR60_06695 [Gemmatimonadales bacterium]|nr:hypothetical protein [Gemmatimonadales bacterium]
MSPGATARAACLLLLAGAAGPLRAQATADRARLAVGLGIAYHGGGHIWTQDGQTIIDQSANVDTATVGRDIQSQFGLSFLAAYFPTEQWGVIGEVQFLGLHYVDSCRLLTNHSGGEAQQICQNIEGRGHDGTAVTLTLGGIFRPWPNSALSPYLRASGGLNVSQNSSVRMIGTWVTSTSEEADYYIFGDPSPGEITPMLGLGGGFTAPTGRGSQFRFEVRDNVVFLRHPTGTQSAPDPGLSPPTKVLASHLFSLNLGFEIVLEKKRGHRY